MPEYFANVTVNGFITSTQQTRSIPRVGRTPTARGVHQSKQFPTAPGTAARCTTGHWAAARRLCWSASGWPGWGTVSASITRTGNLGCLPVFPEILVIRLFFIILGPSIWTPNGGKIEFSCVLFFFIQSLPCNLFILTKICYDWFRFGSN